MIYGGKDLAAAFRTVRASTITIAEIAAVTTPAS